MTLVQRLSRLELITAVVAALALAALVAIEPAILEAPFASRRALLFTVGGTVAAALALLAMVKANVTPVVRVAVLAAPFLAVNWWLLSPYFRDDVVTDAFAVSIADASSPPTASSSAPSRPGEPDGEAGAGADPGTGVAPSGGATSSASGVTPTSADPAPVLLGSGRFAGLAGHEGTGDAAVFRLPDGSQVLRFENFDIDNGPDLRVYLVPGADRTAPVDGSIYLGELRGNVGDQTYALPDGGRLTGPVTALVWCEAFDVEFVAATLQLT